MTLTAGSLFTGTGALDLAVEAVLGELERAFHSDVKPAAVRFLEHRFPDVPNLGDLTRVWPAVGPLTREAAAMGRVDVLTAGWPCQPHSAAGKRLGEADPRALWPNVHRAIRELRPRIFLGENVARIVTNGELRRVIRSLAEIGYVGAWRVVAASDIGAPHQRKRCFVVAVDAAAAHALAGRLRAHVAHVPARESDTARRAALTLLPTPTQSMTTGAGTSGRDGGLNLQTAVTLLPTPKASDGYKGGPSMRGSSGDLALPAVAVTLLPTPSASSYGSNRGGAAGRVGPVRESLDTMARHGRIDTDRWGPYAAAVDRWEAVLDAPAPAPTQPSVRTGKPQLSPQLVEWMMGLPAGWVTDVPDLAPRPAGQRNAVLSMLGDGVVPQQAAHAYRELLPIVLALAVKAGAA